MLKSYFSYLYKNTEKNYISNFFSLFEKDKNARILDCGCWDGINTRKFGDRIGTDFLYGIEINRQKAKQASKNGINAKVSDLNKIFPYRNGFFDVVAANHVIEHLVGVRLFVSEIYRVLKKNGYAVIGTPNLASWHNVFALFLGLQPFSGPTIKPDYESDFGMVKSINKERLDKVFSGSKSSGLDHVKVMTARALIGLLRDFNFNIVDVRSFGYYPLPPSMAKLISKLDPYHGHYIIIKVRK